jgi:RNA polymerase sigma-70 factor, ECF subfamily
LSGKESGGSQLVKQHEEKALARRIVAGDREACVQLVREHHAPIYRLLVHLSRDTHRAEDLVQETFAAAWARMSGFGGASSLRTWLYRIAYRKFLDTQRRRGITSDAVAEIEFVRADAAMPGPLDAAIADEEARRLHAALAELPADEREVVVMHYLQQMKFEEIAEVLDVPAGTLRWRKGRALESLRGLLGQKVNQRS